MKLGEIAKIIADIDENVPFTILAYFPEYKLNARSPTLMEMVKAYMAVEDVGLKNVKLGNIGVFARTEEDIDLLIGLLGDRVF